MAATKKGARGAPAYEIVVGIDLGPSGGEALDLAMGIAAARPDARVHVVHAMDADFSARSAKNILKLDALLDRAAKVLRLYVDRRVNAAMKTRVMAHVRRAAPADAIVQLAVDIDADLVVVGTAPRKGLAAIAHSSVSGKVLKLAPCAVLLAKPKSTTGATKSPRIEPACRACRATRLSTRGAAWWCDDHKKHARGSAHIYSYAHERSFASEVPPGGV